jgi:hypothetical protein
MFSALKIDLIFQRLEAVFRKVNLPPANTPRSYEVDLTNFYRLRRLSHILAMGFCMSSLSILQFPDRNSPVAQLNTRKVWHSVLRVRNLKNYFISTTSGRAGTGYAKWEITPETQL